MEASSHCTLLELLGQAPDFYIEIPAIQRDYAQGRPKAQRVRNAFLMALKEALLEGKKLNLDFVYGNKKTTPLGTAFTPIDGQQRLTTLFLLHWFLAFADSKASFRTFQKQMKLPTGQPKFAYATRASAQEFCQALVGEAALQSRPRQLQQPIKTYLKNCTWFYSSWEQDPTVRAMLHMLQALQDFFYEDRKVAYQALFQQQYLQFELLNLEDWQLTDDLYIKMNSRGRPLTTYENFKAALNQHLQAHYQGEQTTVQHFFYQLDNAWNDAFWQLSQQLAVDYDEAFMRFFNFFLPLLFYWNAPPNRRFGGEEDMLELLEKEEALKLLMAVLDGIAATLAEGEEGLRSFFEATTAQVPLWGPPIHLLEACLENRRFHSRARLLLFATLYYQAQAVEGSFKVNQSFLDFFRIGRNLTMSLEQPSKDDWLPTLRENSYQGLLQSFQFCFAKKHVYRHLAAQPNPPLNTRGALEEEQIKAQLIVNNKKYKPLIHQLEDHPLLHGALHNFNLPQHSLTTLKQQIKTFFYLWPDEQGARARASCARALLAVQDYSQNISSSALGWVWYFGQGKNWARILRARDARVQGALSGLLAKLEGLTKQKIIPYLEQVIQEAAQQPTLLPWQQAFLQYPCILESEQAHVSYAFYSNEPTDYRIEKILGKTLKSPHINVYVEALAHELQLTEGLVYARNREASCLQVNKAVQLYAENGGWHIYGLGIPSSQLLEKFALEADARYTVKTLHKLGVGEGEDMVQVGKRLVEDILD